MQSSAQPRALRLSAPRGQPSPNPGSKRPVHIFKSTSQIPGRETTQMKHQKSRFLWPSPGAYCGPRAGCARSRPHGPPAYARPNTTQHVMHRHCPLSPRHRQSAHALCDAPRTSLASDWAPQKQHPTYKTQKPPLRRRRSQGAFVARQGRGWGGGGMAVQGRER